MKIEDKKLTIKERHNQIPKSERAKMMFLMDKAEKEQQQKKK